MAKLKISVGLVALATALAGCSGGDSGGSAPVGVTPPPAPPAAPPPSPPTAASTTASVGTVTGFSSIVVNGTSIETTPTTVYSIEGEDDVTGDDSVIALGMVVTARATENDDGSLTGTDFIVDDGILGVVESISPDIASPEFGTFVVAGQTIIVDGNTVFDDDISDVDGVSGVDLRDLEPTLAPGGAGLVVEISGFPTEFGAIATRIDLEDDFDANNIGLPSVDDDEIQVVGFVDSVDPLGNFFTINAATFFVNASTDLDDGIEIDDTLVGAFVEVEADIDGTGDFIATEVENEGDDLDDFFDDDFDEDDDFEIEGLLQSVNLEADPDLIVINGVEIEVTDASGLVDFVGQIIEIEGSFNANGVLVIFESEIEDAPSIETEDLIESIDAAGGTFTTRLGLEITPTVSSRLDIDSDAFDDDNLTPDEFLNAISVGDFVEARGVPGAGGVIWTRIEVEDDDDEASCSLEGPAEAGSISDPTFSILGVTVDTTGLDDDDFESDDGADGRTGFFAALMAENIVEAESDDAGLGCATGLLQTFDEGEVSLEIDNDDEDGPDSINRLEISGAISELDATANTLQVAGFLVRVIDATLIDDDIIEEARGEDVEAEEVPFGSLPETLDELLGNGDEVEVVIDADGNALTIENEL